MQQSMITTAFELPEHKIITNVGIVRGITVRSRSIVGSLFGALQTVFGGNITIYTSLCEDARIEAFQLMRENATQNGANAIIGMRYDATDVSPGLTEVICYGTAVITERIK